MWFKKKIQYIDGIIPDTRTSEAKDKDYKLNEIVTSPEPVNWVEKPQNTWRNFELRSQNGSGSCVAQTVAKMLGICHYLNKGYFPTLSASYVYQKRANQDTEGMMGVDAWEIARKYGSVLEENMPSQNLSETKINAVEMKPVYEHIGQSFAVSNYVQLTPNIDEIASVIQKTSKPVMVWFSFDYDEWTDIPTIKRAWGKYNHSVTAVDFTLYQGKKALIIEDSWGAWTSDLGKKGQRIITEDFMPRCWFAAYPINFKYEEETTERPKFDGSVKSLQDILKFEGFFPQNVESTGVFGPITKKALIAFQVKYNIEPAVGFFGDITKAKLRVLYP
jgi:hypothetical protein